MSTVYGEKKNDRSRSSLDLPYFLGILMPQWSIGYYNKLKTIATKFFIAINSKLLQQTLITMKIFIAHYCNKACGNRLLQQ